MLVYVLFLTDALSPSRLDILFSKVNNTSIPSIPNFNILDIYMSKIYPKAMCWGVGLIGISHLWDLRMQYDNLTFFLYSVPITIVFGGSIMLYWNLPRISAAILASYNQWQFKHKKVVDAIVIFLTVVIGVHAFFYIAKEMYLLCRLFYWAMRVLNIPQGMRLG